MWEAYHWVPEDETLYLVMDNAGGHGKKDVRAAYETELKDMNNEIIWLILRSPENNLLNLGSSL